jgi:glutamate-1-semialdehyde aminotransferase
LNNRGDALRIELNAIARKYGTRIQFTGVGSLLGMHSTPAHAFEKVIKARGALLQ